MTCASLQNYLAKNSFSFRSKKDLFRIASLNKQSRGFQIIGLKKLNSKVRYTTNLII